MASNMFLKFEGGPEVKGESEDTGFEKQIEIDSFSLGASNPTTAGLTGGSGAGKATFSDCTVSKRMDLSTGTLFQQMCAGKHFTTATITNLKAAGDKPLKFLEFKLSEVFVTAISWGGAAGNDVSESMSMSFSKIQFNYQAQKGDGTGGDTAGGGWDIRKNTAAGK